MVTSKKVRYIVSDTPIRKLTKSQIQKLPKSDSIIIARKKALEYLKHSKYYDTGIYREDTGEMVGYVKLEIFGNTPYSWNTEKGTIELHKGGTLGKRW